MQLVLLIPAFQPGPELARLVERVAGRDFHCVVVIDDGSGLRYAEVFAACKATILTHSRNRGKGAALKTGMEYVAANFPGFGVVTADADGQHLPADILRVARRLSAGGAESLVMGVRQFGVDTPLRSRIGNWLASLFVQLLLGCRISDTQTGLRGIPPKLLVVLTTIPANGYEFELDMLTAAMHSSVSIIEEPIHAVYSPGNPTSHFRPLRDSLRIGFVLARFSLLSLTTAMLDNAVFLAATQTSVSIATAQFMARVASVLYNYPLARSAVFHSGLRYQATLTKYLLLVAVSGVTSYQLLSYLHGALGWSVFASKLTAESALFVVNFMVQRDFIFISGRKKQ